MKEIKELFTGIINQSKYIHSKHNCGASENLIYMATELQKYFMQFIEDERKKLQAAITLLENLY